MFVPLSLQLTPPFVVHWQGAAGRSYEFAVLGSEPVTIHEPAVYLLVRRAQGMDQVLYVGHGEHFAPKEMGPLWLAARERGMTHVHISFEAQWSRARMIVAEDLIARLKPPLNVGTVSGTGEEGRSNGRIYPQPTPDRPGGESLAATATPEEAAPAAVLTPPQLPRRPLRQRLARLYRLINAAVGRLRSLPTAAAEPVTAAPPRRHDEEGPRAEPPLTAEAAPVAEEARKPSPTGLLATGGLPGAQHEESSEDEAARNQPSALRSRLDLDAAAPVFFFAGEMSKAGGIDILADALITVCSGNPGVQFVLAGSGPLADEVRSWVEAAGYGARCRFVGDLRESAFADYLAACDYLVIPARSPLAGHSAERALALGKPVLTTHQAQIRTVVHGSNGLVAYDSPNSLVWGLREMLSCWPPTRGQEAVERAAALPSKDNGARQLA